MKKKILLASIMLAVVLAGCCPFCSDRENINDYSGYIVKEQICGFDNLDGGRYTLINPKTKKLKSVHVDIEWCSAYSVGDTIK